MMWDDLKKISGAKTVLVPGGYGEPILLPVAGAPTPTPSFWMIGRYKDQTRLATALRQDAALQAFVAAQGVRFGLRDTDRPPAVGAARQERYGAPVAGANAGINLAPQRLQAVSQAVRPACPRRPTARATSWATCNASGRRKTPQSHHVVEFNHLRDLGVSHESGTGPLDHAQLPCVLLAAEFHQRYFSAILKQTHGWKRRPAARGTGKGVFVAVRDGRRAVRGAVGSVEDHPARGRGSRWPEGNLPGRVASSRAPTMIPCPVARGKSLRSIFRTSKPLSPRGSQGINIKRVLSAFDTTRIATGNSSCSIVAIPNLFSAFRSVVLALACGSTSTQAQTVILDQVGTSSAVF